MDTTIEDRVDDALKIKEFDEFYHNNHPNLQRAGDSFRSILLSLLKDISIYSIIFRVKEKSECIKKYNKKYKDNKLHESIQSSITDLLGLRITCLYITDIDKMRPLILGAFELIEETDKLHPQTTNEFGYRSLHLDLRLKQDRIEFDEYRDFKEIRFELQLRTVIQDAWSTLDHKINYKNDLPDALKRSINSLAAVFELADNEFQRLRDETNKIKITKEEEVKDKPKDVLVNGFNFNYLMQQKFTSYHFYADRCSDMAEELLSANPELTFHEIDLALQENIGKVKELQNYIDQVFNPYTIVRHALFLSDKARYATLLLPFQRVSIEGWIAHSEKESKV
jgi:putative GTP pyrophosphokinase